MEDFEDVLLEVVWNESIDKANRWRCCVAWHSYMELHLKSTIIASDCLQSLKTIREDLSVRVLEPGENPRELSIMILILLIVCTKHIMFWPCSLSVDQLPLTSTWPHLNSDVGLEEGEY